jgi:hypothetical protein
MQTLITYSVLILLHFIGDFIMQSDKDAKGKSTSFKCLVSHTSTYVVPFIVVGAFFFPFDMVNVFAIITFLAHTITDYFTSKLNSKLWKSGNTHNFFISVGFDQVLHYIQLFVTFYLLF